MKNVCVKCVFSIGNPSLHSVYLGRQMEGRGSCGGGNEPGLLPLFCILQEGLRTRQEFSTLNVAIYSVNRDNIWEWPKKDASVKAQCLNVVVLIHLCR